jgi:hypothetical protein
MAFIPRQSAAAVRSEIARPIQNLRDIRLVDALFAFPIAFARHPGAALAAKLI